MKTRWQVTSVFLCAVLLLAHSGRSDGASSAGAGAEWAVLQATPPEVAVRLQRATEGSPWLDWCITWRVVRGSECLALPSTCYGDDSSAVLKALRNDFVQHGAYLFIATRDAGGNHWKGRGAEVIALRGERLVPLGWLGELDAGSAAPDACWRNGEFLDLDADWESAFTGHATAPQVELVLRDSAGTLVVDLLRTWARSRPIYQRNERLWRRTAPGAANDFARVAALFENAVIASYCHRTREAAETMAAAERILQPTQLAAIRDTLANVRSGALPRRSQPRSVPCGATR
jgi:hypothetical protein